MQKHRLIIKIKFHAAKIGIIFEFTKQKPNYFRFFLKVFESFYKIGELMN